METHYACSGGCGGSSAEPVECGTESCSKIGQNMTACSCSDNQHKEILEPTN